MKTILFLSCVITIITGSGCLVAEGGRHGRGHGEFHGRTEVEVIAPAPVIIVPVVPVVRVR